MGPRAKVEFSKALLRWLEKRGFREPLRKLGPVTPEAVRAYEVRAEAIVSRATRLAERRARGPLPIRGWRWLRRAIARPVKGHGTTSPTAAASARDVPVSLSGPESRPPISSSTGLRVAIKSPAPDAVAGQAWGDFHFAHALARALERRGHVVRVDHRDTWTAASNSPCDGVIVLRGRHRYRPDRSIPAILWNISHPELINRDEYEDFDRIFVASALGARMVKTRFPHLRVDVLLQAFDAERFRVAPGSDTEFDVLFVGNTRGVHRPVVIDAIEARLPLTVFGKGWERLIPARFIGGGPVPNEQLPQMYGAAKVVLNDHWPSMRSGGFISNRIFDVAACSVPVVTDPILGLTEIFGGSVMFYRHRRELARTVRGLLASSDERARLGAEARRVVEGVHDFDARALVIEQALIDVRLP